MRSASLNDVRLAIIENSSPYGTSQGPSQWTKIIVELIISGDCVLSGGVIGSSFGTNERNATVF